MSKKKFKIGLESVFGIASEESFEGGLLLAEQPSPPKSRLPIGQKRSSRKNFTSDLEILFKAALKESLDKNARKQTQDIEAKQKVLQHQIPHKKPLGGLDNLIRQTVETAPETDYRHTPVKRVTFVFDRKKLEKLKQIARHEKAYLKDLIGDAVSEFIQEYEQKGAGLE